MDPRLFNRFRQGLLITCILSLLVPTSLASGEKLSPQPQQDAANADFAIIRQRVKFYEDTHYNDFTQLWFLVRYTGNETINNFQFKGKISRYLFGDDERWSNYNSTNISWKPNRTRWVYGFDLSHSKYCSNPWDILDSILPGHFQANITISSGNHISYYHYYYFNSHPFIPFFFFDILPYLLDLLPHLPPQPQTIFQ